MIQRYTQPVMETDFVKEISVQEVPLVPDNNGKWCRYEDVTEMVRLLRFVLDKGDGPVWLSDGWRADAESATKGAPVNV